MNTCSDEDACTTRYLQRRRCVPGSPVTCDDDVACTDDTCAPADRLRVRQQLRWPAGPATMRRESARKAAPAIRTATTATCARPTRATCPNAAALNFDGSNDYVTMGAAAGETALGARAFTLEAWVKRDGASWGTTTSTGNGWRDRGSRWSRRAAASRTRAISTATTSSAITAAGVPVADFEQIGAAGGWADGQNHPACGTGAITDQNWHHVAVTYSTADGWRVYIDGVEGTAADGTSCTTCNPAGSCPRSPGVEPEYDSIQHFGLGTAMTSTGAADGLLRRDDGRGPGLEPGPYPGRDPGEHELCADRRAPVSSAAGASRRGRGRRPPTRRRPPRTARSLTARRGSPRTCPSLGDGTCAHAAVPGCCNTGSRLQRRERLHGGHVHGPRLRTHATRPTPGCCTVAADCNDGNSCTDDSCDGSSTCVNAAQHGIVQ